MFLRIIKKVVDVYSFFYACQRIKNIKVEGLGNKRDSPVTSKKRGRTEPPKEDVTVQKKQKIKSLVNCRFIFQ